MNGSIVDAKVVQYSAQINSRGDAALRDMGCSLVMLNRFFLKMSFVCMK